LSPHNRLTVNVKTVRIALDVARAHVFFDCTAVRQDMASAQDALANLCNNTIFSDAPPPHSAPANAAATFTFPVPAMLDSHDLPSIEQSCEQSTTAKPKVRRPRKMAARPIDPLTGEPIVRKRQRKTGTAQRRGKQTVSLDDAGVWGDDAAMMMQAHIQDDGDILYNQHMPAHTPLQSPSSTTTAQLHTGSSTLIKLLQATPTAPPLDMASTSTTYTRMPGPTGSKVCAYIVRRVSDVIR
jgi:hypothetical protein